MDTQVIEAKDGSEAPSNDEHKSPYPVSFLSFLELRLMATIQRLMAFYNVPAKGLEAIDDLVFLANLVGTDPKTFKPGGTAGYEREINQHVSSVTWLIDELEDLQNREFLTVDQNGAIQPKNGRDELIKLEACSGWGGE